MKLIRKFESYSQEREEMCKYLCNVCGCSMHELEDKSDDELEEMCRTMSEMRVSESYSQDREEMCRHLCRCGYSEEDLEMCSDEELRQMCRSHEAEMMNNQNLEESKKWIQDTKMKKGALHKQLGYKQDEKIPAGIINKISKGELGKKVEVKGKDKTITPLLKKRATLAKTLKGFNEHQETQNYMFFGNLHTIKRLVDGLLEMDESQLDNILTEHDWASDHISVAAENIEHVFNFLANHDEPTHDSEEGIPGGSWEDEDETEFPGLEGESGDELAGEITEEPIEEEPVMAQRESIRSFRNFK